MGVGRAALLDMLPELGAADREFIEASSYGGSRGLGRSPALVLVDFQHAYLGRDEPVLAQLADFPAAGGSAAWSAMRCVLPLLHRCRGLAVPVVLTRIVYSPEGERSNAFAAKRAGSEQFVDGAAGARFATELAADDDDVQVRKESASAFHGTDLDTRLRAAGVDTVLVAGLTTSGCVRATAVDAASNGYRVAVIEDATADRVDLSRRVAILDLWMKYADVLTASEAETYVKRCVDENSVNEERLPR